RRQQAAVQRFRFTETQAADAESVKCEAAKEFRTLPPKAFIESTLDDPKPQLARRTVVTEAAHCPAMRLVHRGSGDGRRCRPGDGLVEGHRDIGAKLALHRHD